MTRQPQNLSHSIRDRLLQLARQQNEEFQNYLMRFALERWMYRLSQSEAWCKLPPVQKLTKPLREQFHAAGWEFGHSILKVRHCPACLSEAEINDQKDAVKTALDDLLGEDEDGLLAMYEDFGL